MLYATSEADSDAIKAALPDFKSTFGMDLALDTMPYDALQQKAFAELASGSSYYDIMIVDTPWMPALTDKILPITGMMLDPSVSDAAQLNLGDFIPKVFFDTTVYKRGQSYLHWPGQPVMDAGAIKKGGFEIYGLPIQANVATLAYRADMFNDRGDAEGFPVQDGRVPSRLRRPGMTSRLSRSSSPDPAEAPVGHDDDGRRRGLGNRRLQDVAGKLWRRRASGE